MIKPAQGSVIYAADRTTAFVVIDEDPRNWKDGVGVREILPAGQLGELRIFDQQALVACIPEHVILGRQCRVS